MSTTSLVAMLGSTSEALSILTPLSIRNSGARLEGDVFSILKQSPFVVRSFEFALADGAIDCTQSFD